MEKFEIPDFSFFLAKIKYTLFCVGKVSPCLHLASRQWVTYEKMAMVLEKKHHYNLDEYAWVFSTF